MFSISVWSYYTDPNSSTAESFIALDYVFDIFAAFARAARVIERFFFLHFAFSPPLPGFRETERGYRSEERNLQRNRIACKDNPLLVRPCVIYYVLQ